MRPQDVEPFLRSIWRTVPDPNDAEFIRTPAYQFRIFAEHDFMLGDCDDASVMAALLLTCSGTPCWFVAIRLKTDAEYSHVFVRGAGVGDIDIVTAPELLPINFHLVAEIMAVQI